MAKTKKVVERNFTRNKSTTDKCDTGTCIHCQYKRSWNTTELDKHLAKCVLYQQTVAKQPLEQEKLPNHSKPSKELDLDHLFALAVCTSTANFSLFQTPEWKLFFKRLGYEPPTRNTLANTHLESTYERIKNAASASGGSQSSMGPPASRLATTVDRNIHPDILNWQTPANPRGSVEPGTGASTYSPAPASTGRSRKRNFAVFENNDGQFTALDKSQLLDEKNRWMCFLNHNHDDEDALKAEIYGIKTAENAGEWLSAHNKIGENTRNWKSGVLKAMIAHVPKVMAAHPELEALEEDELKKEVYKLMNKSTFTVIWAYMKNYCDYDRCKKLGKFYIGNTYANLFAAAKVEVDLKAAKKEIESAHKALSDLYNVLPKVPEHQKIRKDHFFVIESSVSEPISKKKAKDIIEKSYSAAAQPPSDNSADEEDEDFEEETAAAAAAGGGPGRENDDNGLPSIGAIGSMGSTGGIGGTGGTGGTGGMGGTGGTGGMGGTGGTGGMGGMEGADDRIFIGSNFQYLQ